MELDVEIPARDRRKHPELAERVQRAVVETADLVREYGQMPLGGPLVVRLVSRRGFARCCRRYDRDVIMAGVHADDLVSARRVRTLRRVKRVANVPVLALARRVVPAQTVNDGGDGRPMITLVPTNITQRHIGMPELAALVAHELTHVAQFAVAPDHQSKVMQRVLHIMTAKEPHNQPPAHTLLFEGHATWVQLRVTEQLFGQPTWYRPPKRTFRGRVNNWVARLSPATKDRHRYNEGAVFAGHVIEQHGHDLMRRVLQEPDLWPWASEIADPPAWSGRIIQDSEVAGAHRPAQ